MDVMHLPPLRPDQQLIKQAIAPGSRVLDVGCRDGALLTHLARELDATAHGLELEQASVNEAVARGLYVVQGDANSDLADYPDDAFDTVILSSTLQALYQPKEALQELRRIGRRVVVSVPNFGHWRVRTYLTFKGRMPVTRALDARWYETENIHLCTINDLFDLVDEVGLKVVQFTPLDEEGNPRSYLHFLPNLFASQALIIAERQ